MATGGGASRQKSCNACVRGKRRCDKRLPACGRCERKMVACSYSGLADRRQRQPLTNTDSFVAINDASPACSADMPLDLPDFSAPLEPNLTLEPNVAWSFDSVFDFSRAPVDLTIGNWQPTPLHQAQIADPQEKTLTRKDYMHLGTVCDDYQPWQLEDPSAKMAFIVKVVKGLPEAFSRTQSTPYCHRALYSDNMPSSVMQAFTTCVLYTNKTKENRAIMLRVLLGNIKDLVESDPAATLTSHEKLARIHALIMYQIIRMFDGDITLGQQADNDFDLLESWAHDLYKVRDNLVDHVAMDEATVRNSPPESWQRWVFSETLRRTVVMAHVLRSIWNLLRGYRTSKEVGSWAFVHRWTLSSHLWEAPSSYDFFRAWKEKPFWVISVFEFSQFLKTGTGDDLDEFGRWFLTLYFGVDEIRTFLSNTSSVDSTA